MSTRLRPRVNSPTQRSSFILRDFGWLQRKCACDGSAGLTGTCGACAAKKRPMQRRAVGHAAPGTVPPIVHDVLRSPGQPLDGEDRAFFEPRFGHDFSRVRVHTDARAVASAQAVNALAYTVGDHVVFGAGRYAPQTATGRGLMAHELTHVVQQAEVRTPGHPHEYAVSVPGSPSEREADRAADASLAATPEMGRAVTPVPGAVPLQRAVSYDECTAAQETTVLDSHNRAVDMVDTAITKLGTYNGKTPADVQRALDTHFHSSGTVLAAWIRSNLFWLKGEVDSPTYECETPQVGTRLGWSMWCVPWTDIELYPLWFAEGLDERARTMIHEWVHRYGCNFDLGYEWQEGYSGHGTLRSLLNADPWAHFVYDVR